VQWLPRKWQLDMTYARHMKRKKRENTLKQNLCHRNVNAVGMIERRPRQVSIDLLYYFAACLNAA